MRKKEILPLVIAWMDLKGIMLDETSQKKKDRYYMISLTYEIKKTKQNKKHLRNKEQSGDYQRQDQTRKMGKSSQKVQTFCFQIDKFWGCNIHCVDYI